MDLKTCLLIGNPQILVIEKKETLLHLMINFINLFDFFEERSNFLQSIEPHNNTTVRNEISKIVKH